MRVWLGIAAGCKAQHMRSSCWPTLADQTTRMAIMPVPPRAYFKHPEVQQSGSRPFKLACRVNLGARHLSQGQALILAGAPEHTDKQGCRTIMLPLDFPSRSLQIVRPASKTSIGTRKSYLSLAWHTDLLDCPLVASAQKLVWPGDMQSRAPGTFGTVCSAPYVQ